MKKIFYYICAVTMVLSIVSCGGKGKNDAKNDGSKVSSVSGNTSSGDVSSGNSSSANVAAADTSTVEAGDANWFMAQTEKAPVKSVTASSELVEAKFAGKFLYPPINILDGDFKNTWCESVDGDGIGEAVTIEFEEPVSFDEIQVVNGFATDESWEINNRIKTLQITQVAGKHYQRKDYELQDGIKDWQSIKFEYPQTAQTIELAIKDVYKGTQYEDTCLDDVRLLYRGNEIPFTGVEKLKKIQEENSRAMLNSDFESKFKALFKKCANVDDPFIYLVIDGGNERGCVMKVDTEDGKFNLVDFDFCEFLPSDIDEEVVKEKNLTDFADRMSKSNYTRIALVEDGPGLSEYSIGNCKIYEKSRLSYVNTTVAKLVSVDGNIVTINGVKYTVVPSDETFVAYLPMYPM